MAVLNVGPAVAVVDNGLERANAPDVDPNAFTRSDVEVLNTYLNYEKNKILNVTPKKTSVDKTQIPESDDKKAEIYRMVRRPEAVEAFKVIKNECEKGRKRIMEYAGKKGEDIGTLVGRTVGLPAGLLGGAALGNCFVPGVGALAGGIIGLVGAPYFFGMFGGFLGRVYAEAEIRRTYSCSPTLQS